MRDLFKNWSHCVRGLEYREATKEAANIYCQNSLIILFIAKVNHYNPHSLQPSQVKKKPPQLHFQPSLLVARNFYSLSIFLA
jgi:hypothetical protein